MKLEALLEWKSTGQVVRSIGGDRRLGHLLRLSLLEPGEEIPGPGIGPKAEHPAQNARTSLAGPRRETQLERTTPESEAPSEMAVHPPALKEPAESGMKGDWGLEKGGVERSRTH